MVAILGLVIFIMSLVAVFSMPGKNFGDFVKQGKMLGPWMTLLGSLSVLAGSIGVAVFGLLAFIKKMTGK